MVRKRQQRWVILVFALLVVVVAALTTNVVADVLWQVTALPDGVIREKIIFRSNRGIYRPPAKHYRKCSDNKP